MKSLFPKHIDGQVVVQSGHCINMYPLLRNEYGIEIIWLISPQHGRTYLVATNEDGRYIISKGNGLSYTIYSWLNSSEQSKDVWGLLLKEDALRDFTIGISTFNHMFNR